MSEIDNSFIQTLNNIRNGLCTDELSEKLAELVGQVRLTGKKGVLKLSLSVAPASRGKTNALMLSDDIALKLPQLEQASSIFYTDDDCRLSRNDPNQQEFEGMRTVSGGDQEIKDVNPTTENQPVAQ